VAIAHSAGERSMSKKIIACNEVYRRNRNLDESRRLNPELQTLEQWLNANASTIAVPA
jgi:hypothetical protein